MSVTMTMRVAADTEVFRNFVENNADLLKEISEDSRANGAIHHRFAIGDRYIMVIDDR
jgi:hypothetical protein